MDKNHLFSSYDTLPKTWDEMYNENADFRFQYEEFIKYLEKTSPEKLKKRRFIQAIIYESRCNLYCL